MAAIELAIEPNPNFRRLEAVLRRQGEPDRVPFYELFSNIQADVLRALGKLDETSDAALTPQEREERAWRQHITYMLALGYDYVNGDAYGFGFPQGERARGMTPQGERAYIRGADCRIANRKDFEEYPWPDMGSVDYSPLERIGTLLPDGMKVICGSSGVLENVMWLLGYEGISYLLHDDERFVGDMFDAVGSRVVEYLGTAASFDTVGAVTLGDDLGFKTQTLLSPGVFRAHLFPWHKRIVEAVHQHGKPAILHACGNLSEVMDDVIACGWEARHSFEDTIEPVWEAKERYGGRIALLGGFDVDRISRSTPAQVREHTRFLIDKCAPGGGWALGTGNSVANYVPVANFLAMLDEGSRAGRY